MASPSVQPFCRILHCDMTDRQTDRPRHTSVAIGHIYMLRIYDICGLKHRFWRKKISKYVLYLNKKHEKVQNKNMFDTSRPRAYSSGKKISKPLSVRQTLPQSATLVEEHTVCSSMIRHRLFSHGAARIWNGLPNDSRLLTFQA